MGQLLYQGIWCVQSSVHFVFQARSPALLPVVVNVQGLASIGLPLPAVNAPGPELLQLRWPLHWSPLLQSSKYSHLLPLDVEL